jgi:chromate transporter
MNAGDEMTDDVTEIQAPAGERPRGGLGEIFVSFGKLGLISFGGPVAHLGYFRTEFVEKRGWLGDEEYADLVALCQFLPGPASSQVVFGLGFKRAGVLGGILASVCFTLPSAVMMIACAYGVTALGDVSQAGWLHGLKLAAVAVVAQAVWGMARNLCPDLVRVTLCILAAAVLLLCAGALAQVGVIAMGALAGWLIYRKDVVAPALDAKEGRGVSHLVAAGVLALFMVLLVVLPVIAQWSGSRAAAEFDGFYRAGSLVFGGGHVVLPLLREVVVSRGWVTDDAFLAGYGLAQAVPGPLFSFSAYLGAVMHPGKWAWAHGLWCLVAIFLPAWLLVGGALPFWHRLRAKAWAQASLRGANAAVVGVLLAALYQPVITEGVHGARDVAVAGVAFCALHIWKAPAWAVVLVMAGVGCIF